MLVLHAPWPPVRPEAQAQAQHMRREARALVKKSQTDSEEETKGKDSWIFSQRSGHDELLVGLEVHALVDALNPALAVLLETTQNLSTCTNSQTAKQPSLESAATLTVETCSPMRSSRRNEFGLTHWRAVACTAQCIKLCQTPNTAAFTTTHALEMDELTSSDKSIEPCAHTTD